MARRDDEGEQPKKPRFKLMHFTMLMLAMVMVSKISEVATATKELVSIRQAEASSAPKEEEKPVATEEKAETKQVEGDAAAEEEKAKDSEAAKEEGEHKEEAKEEGGHGGGEEEALPPGEEKTLGAGKLTVNEVEAIKAKEAGSPYTPSELDLLTNLTKRRNELDERESELEMKSKVLDATELRITNKVNEMKVLQAELTKVIAQYKQQQDGEIKSLVKIYENMKPLDAAAIFNEMDMPILLEVIDKMSERKVAPVLAGMDPRRARDVTQELAEMRRGRAALNNAASAATAP